MQTVKILTFFILLSISFGCTVSSNLATVNKQISHHHRSTSFYLDSKKKKLSTIQYFNKEGQLIEQIGFESRVKYVYSPQGQLTNQFHCRLYNCDLTYGQKTVYDNRGNAIGTQVMKGLWQQVDSVWKNVDSLNTHSYSAPFKQTKFYNQANQLINELTDTGTQHNGSEFETFMHYVYANNRIVKEIEITNADTVWVGNYYYDKDGNTTSIYRQNGAKFEIETFEYDQHNRLTKKTMTSNLYPATKDVSYTASNNSRIFQYNAEGKMVEETVYNHLGEAYLKFYYEYAVNSQQEAL